MAKWHVMLNERVLDTFWVQEGQTVTIGRGETSDVSVDNVAVSRQHATFEVRNDIHFLTDLGSVNGTLVNGHRIHGSVPVTETDLIQIGKFHFVLVPTQEQVPPATKFADFEATMFVRPKDKPGHASGVRGPRLTVTEGTATPRELYLEQNKTVMLGKDSDCDICVQGWLVAKIHCYIWAKDSEHHLVHRAGWRRTTLNGRKIRGKQKLRKGDTIGIGRTKLKYE